MYYSGSTISPKPVTNRTSMEYLRRVRPHYAHLDLVASNRATSTVGTVAAKWGFNNIGRFAVAYRQAYGHSPHITLRYSLVDALRNVGRNANRDGIDPFGMPRGHPVQACIQSPTMLLRCRQERSRAVTVTRQSRSSASVGFATTC